MSNIIAAIIFCVLSFVMWLAVFFTVMDKLIGEKKLFLNYVRAIMTYLIGSIYSVYEHERKKFDPEVYRKCKGYLHERRVKNGTINT